MKKWAKKAVADNPYVVGLIMLSSVFGGGVWFGNSVIKQPSADQNIQLKQSNEIEEPAQEKCDSAFTDENWNINSWWQREGQMFTYDPKQGGEQNGGPKMTYKKDLASDNFQMVTEFVPIMSENNKKNEINFVINIGNSYKIVLGDGNNGYFYMKQEDKFVSGAYKNYKGPIALENKIRFNSPVVVLMNQNARKNSSIIDVDISFQYSPEENPNTSMVKTNTYKFSINKGTFYNEKREISLGLLFNKKSQAKIILNFNCFHLENR